MEETLRTAEGVRDEITRPGRPCARTLIVADRSSRRLELASWYVDEFRPKLRRAGRMGRLSGAQIAELERVMGDLLAAGTIRQEPEGSSDTSEASVAA